MISLVLFASSIVPLCNSYHENRLSYLHNFGHFILDEINRITHSTANNLDDTSLDHLTVEPNFGPHCGPDGSDLVSKISAQMIPDGFNFQFRHHSYSVSFSAACRSHDLCLAAEAGLDSDILCDERFRSDLQIACDTLQHSLRFHCERLAFAYYSAATAWTRVRNTESYS
jgi:hypothetical protein